METIAALVIFIASLLVLFAFYQRLRTHDFKKL